MSVIIVLVLLSGTMAVQLPVETNIELSAESASILSTDSVQVKQLHDGNANDITNNSNSTLYANLLEVKRENARSWCEYPFEPVAGQCFFFSDAQMSFSEAETYCNSLTIGHTHEITLAMSNFDNDDDQALLSKAASKNKTFWIGGKTEDGLTWTWINGQDVDLQMPFWFYTEPDTAANKCMVTKVTKYVTNPARSYIYDNHCDEFLNFICQTGPLLCPLGFQRIYDNCYFLSEDASLPLLLWQEARDYCRDLAVPVGYFADLAVLDLSDKNSAHLINTFTSGNTDIWIGLYEDINCDYWWVNGNSQSKSSNFWLHEGIPSCSGDGSFHSRLCSIGDKRTYFCLSGARSTHQFVCQMFN